MSEPWIDAAAEEIAEWCFRRPDEWFLAKDREEILEILRRRAAPTLERERRLEAALRKHREQRVDDRCWLDDVELYRVLDDGIEPDNTLPPREEFLANCERFYDQRCQAGNWPSYQDLEERVRRLREASEKAMLFLAGLVEYFAVPLEGEFAQLIQELRAALDRKE